jgi:hypothetical protein
MAHKKQHTNPVPPGNQPQGGPAGANDAAQQQAGGGAPFHEHDAKRRLGGFESAGEHARQQPSELNDGGQGNRKDR